MKSLNEDIKSGTFKQAYLLYGEEAYLKKQYKDKITAAMFPDGDRMNYAYYEGKGINPGELIDLAETMPFFADRRLIVVENSGFFKTATPELADYIKNMPETACFLFVEQEVDKRGKLYKAVKDKGRVAELGRQDEKTLLYWIAGNMKREGKQIRESTARYLVNRTGNIFQHPAYKYTAEQSDGHADPFLQGHFFVEKENRKSHDKQRRHAKKHRSKSQCAVSYRFIIGKVDAEHP